MFICEDCIKNYIIDGVKWNESPRLIFYLRSKGPCEDCHEVKLCYDLPHNSYYHKDSEYAKRLDSEYIKKLEVK